MYFRFTKGNCPTIYFKLSLLIMKKTLIRAILPIAILFTIISCTTESAMSPVADAQVNQKYDYQPEEIELANLINGYRASKGLKTLELVNFVSIKAEEHDQYMIANNVVNHDFFEERSQSIIQVLGAVKVNENVAFNFTTPNSVLTAWLNSPGHKANIEGDFTNLGISTKTDVVTGKKYYTNIFVKK